MEDEDEEAGSALGTHEYWEVWAVLMILLLGSPAYLLFIML